jgi:hypothetical protein
MYWKHVNTRSSYCVSMVVVYKIWWALVGTLSDLQHYFGTTLLKRLPTPVIQSCLVCVQNCTTCMVSASYNLQGVFSANFACAIFLRSTRLLIKCMFLHNDASIPYTASAFLNTKRTVRWLTSCSWQPRRMAPALHFSFQLRTWARDSLNHFCASHFWYQTNNIPEFRVLNTFVIQINSEPPV